MPNDTQIKFIMASIITPYNQMTTSINTLDQTLIGIDRFVLQKEHRSVVFMEYLTSLPLGIKIRSYIALCLFRIGVSTRI